MIAYDDMIRGFLEACPGLRPGWDERLRPEDVCGDAPSDHQRVGTYLAACYRRGETAEFPAAFSFLERCVAESAIGFEKDPEAPMMFVNLLSPLWYELRDRPAEAEAFAATWLQPYSRVLWAACAQAAQLFAKFFAEHPLPGKGATRQPGPGERS